MTAGGHHALGKKGRARYTIPMDNKETLILAERVIRQLVANKLYITTVESCTGGGLAYYLTNVPGASEALKDSFVTYSNEAKIALGVPADIIERFGVYSQETAIAMAEAGLARSVKADIAVGITGRIIEDASENAMASTIFVSVLGLHRAAKKQLSLNAMPRVKTKEDTIQEALRMILQII